MPILVDFSSMLITKCTGFSAEFTRGQSVIKMNQIARHVFLDSMLEVHKKWSDKCGEIVICADDENYWRKDIFPNYKASRKATKEASKTDWDSIKAIRTDLEAELREVFPWKVVKADHAEADDVVGVIVKYHNTNDLKLLGMMEAPQKCLAISSDHDYLQLYRYKHYAQWCPRKKIILPKPESTFLLEKILRGDSGDGICNVMSHPDSLVNGIKQTSCTNKFVEAALKAPRDLPPEIMKRLVENRNLIDFDCIPKNISESIIHEYTSANPVKDKTKIFQYCVDRRLKQITEKVSQF
jgi:hypothetical protein